MISFLLLLFAGSFQETQDSTDTAFYDSLPSLNHWALIFSIETSSELQSMLNITPSQLMEIQSAKRSEAIRELFVRRTVEKESNRNTQKDELFSDPIYLQIDPTIKRLLTTILSEKQMADLRPRALLVKFRNPIRALGNAEVMRFMGLPESESERYQVLLEDAQEKYVRQRLLLMTQSTREIVDSMETSVKLLFAQYAGNKHCPNYPLSPVVQFKDLPFPASVKSADSVLSLTSATGFANMIGLSQTQTEKMDEAARIIGEIRHGRFSDKKLTLSEQIDLVNKHAVETIDRILTAEQLTTLARYIALREFEANPRRAIADRRLIAYLQLDPVEEKSLIQTVDSEHGKLHAKTQELHRRIFYDLCDKLPNESKNKMIALFAKVWDY